LLRYTKKRNWDKQAKIKAAEGERAKELVDKAYPLSKGKTSNTSPGKQSREKEAVEYSNTRKLNSWVLEIIVRGIIANHTCRYPRWNTRNG
jgi:hypothetical protein